MRIAAAVTAVFVAVMGAAGMAAMNGGAAPASLVPPTSATSTPAAQPAPVAPQLMVSGDEEEDGFDDD